MNVEELYRELKDVFGYFGLRYADMAQVTVTVDNHACLVFTHAGRTVIVPLDKTPDAT